MLPYAVGSSGSPDVPSTRWSESSTMNAASSSGIPRMRTITLMGSGAATAVTKSPSPSAISRSSRSEAISRVACSYSATLPGVKAALTSRRSRVCSGGSVSSIDRRASSASGSRSKRSTCSAADENVAGSLEMATMSSWRVIAQNPLLRSDHSCQWTGAWSRRSRNDSCGSFSS